MVKLTVLYGHPDDPDKFEEYYHEVHMPLARAIRDVEFMETGKVIASPQGDDLPYYRVAELWFADLATLQASMASEAGRSAADDIANFATGGATLLISSAD